MLPILWFIVRIKFFQTLVPRALVPELKTLARAGKSKSLWCWRVLENLEDICADPAARNCGQRPILAFTAKKFSCWEKFNKLLAKAVPDMQSFYFQRFISTFKVFICIDKNVFRRTRKIYIHKKTKNKLVRKANSAISELKQCCAQNLSQKSFELFILESTVNFWLRNLNQINELSLKLSTANTDHNATQQFW